nr:MAG TPA_asm: hypothetical protein [Caudoviricetes sp.]
MSDNICHCRTPLYLLTFFRKYAMIKDYLQKGDI